MKIVHILNHMKDCGNGIVCTVVDLATVQVQAGHEVYIISNGGDFEPLLQEYGIHHIHIDQTRRPLTILRALINIHKKFKEMKPDIVHAHMMTGLVLTYALKFFHRFMLVSTVHNEFQRTARLMGFADKVIAVSEDVKTAMIRRGISGKKLFVVKNGTIGSPRFANDNSKGVGLYRPSIATVAGMYERKGIITLIEAFSLIKQSGIDAHLYLIGEGPDRPAFERLVQDNTQRDYIHFTGFQPNVRDYLKEVDIFVLASTKESFGLALAEAREAGCAVIGSNVGGIPEVLDYGKAGQLFPSGDSQALADILQELLSSTQTLTTWKENAKINLHWLSTQRVYEDTLNVYTA